MTRLILTLCLLACLLAGCRGVQLSPEFSQRLDEAAILAKAAANEADANVMPVPEMKRWLRWHATEWAIWQDARDARKAGDK